MVYNVPSCICMEFVVRDNTPSQTVSVEVSTNHIRRGGACIREVMSVDLVF